MCMLMWLEDALDEIEDAMAVEFRDNDEAKAKLKEAYNKILEAHKILAQLISCPDDEDDWDDEEDSLE